MFSTGRSVNDKEVSRDLEKTNHFLSDPLGMTAHSSAMIVLRTEQLQQQGPSADLSWHHQAMTAITQLCQRLSLQLNAWLHVSHPQNPATKREEKSTDLLWCFFSMKQGFQRRKAMQWLWEASMQVASIKEIHFSLFGK